MAYEQDQIFPEVKIVKTPKIVEAICECIGAAGHKLSFIPSLGLTHGDHVPSWLEPAPIESPDTDVLN